MFSIMTIKNLYKTTTKSLSSKNHINRVVPRAAVLRESFVREQKFYESDRLRENRSILKSAS